MTDFPRSGRDTVPTAGEPSAAPLPGERSRRWDRRVTGTLAAVVPEQFREPLREAFAPTAVELRVQPRQDASENRGDPYDVRQVVREDDPDGVLLVVPPAWPLDAVTPGPVVDGTPVGLLPAADPGAIDGWLGTVGGDPSPVPAWSVLAMGTDRYLEPAGDLYSRLSGPDGLSTVTVHDWRASRIDRPTLCASLGRGPALCVYLGHATAGGWGGYQNCEYRHVAAVERIRPVGTVLSLSCGTLSDGPLGTPFGVRFVGSGRTRTFVGSPGDVSVEGIRAVADVLAEVVLATSPSTVGELLATIHGEIDSAGRKVVRSLRIVGSPVEPLF